MKNFIEDSAEQIMLNSMSNVFITEKLDPVGKEDDDIDNDGDSDKSDSYLRKRRQAVGAAIAAEKSKRVKKEELEVSLRQKVEGLTEKKLYRAEKATVSDEKDITVEEKPVKNTIVINPDIQEGMNQETISEKSVSIKQQRFMGMVRAAQKGEKAASPEVAKVAASMKKKDVKDFASTKHDKLPEKKSVKEEIAAIAEGARKPEVEEKGKKVAELEREGRAKGITDRFRKEYPGSRQEKKERGRKQTEGELTQERIKKHNERVRKHGFTSKEKKESKAREKYDSARD